jgi:membrane protein DedA with SNARE-associated domain
MHLLTKIAVHLYEDHLVVNVCILAMMLVCMSVYKPHTMRMFQRPRLRSVVQNKIHGARKFIKMSACPTLLKQKFMVYAKDVGSIIADASKMRGV